MYEKFSFYSHTQHLVYLVKVPNIFVLYHVFLDFHNKYKHTNSNRVLFVNHIMLFLTFDAVQKNLMKKSEKFCNIKN